MKSQFFLYSVKLIPNSFRSNWKRDEFSLTIFFLLWLKDNILVLGPRRSSLSQWWWLSFFVTLHCSLTQSVLLCVPRRSSSPSNVDWRNRCFSVEVRVLFFIAFGLLMLNQHYIIQACCCLRLNCWSSFWEWRVWDFGLRGYWE